MRPERAILLGTLLVLTAGPLPAVADAPPQPADSGTVVDTSRWACTLCPYRYGWYGEIDFGGGWVSDASNKFGDYRGLQDQGGFAAVDGHAYYRDAAGRFVDFRALDVGIESRQLEVHGGKRGKYALSLGYREIPKFRGYGTETPYRGVGGDNLTLPAAWQPAAVTSGMSALDASLQSIELESNRTTLDIGLKWKLGSRWSYEVDYQHQSRDGTRPFGAGVFTINASHLPAPVDFSTDRLDAALNFSGDRSHWRLGFSGSVFDNASESVTWDNPFTAQPGTERLRASLAPDNTFYQFDLAGAWAPISRIRLSGMAAVGRMEQDDALLPYSINPEYADLPLPRLTADTRIDVGTVNLSGKLTARLARRLDLTARLRRDERDNETPVDLWTPIITDFLERGPRPNRPYSFERDRASLTLRYRPAGPVRFRAGTEWEDYRRTLQAVRDTRESGWFAEASYQAGSKLEFRARFDQSDRDGEPYVPVEDFALPEHPLMRKFNLADRERERFRFDIDFFPTPDILLNVAWRNGEDEYRESMIGLRESETRSLSLDLSYSPGEVITAYAFASREAFDSVQAGAEGETETPWLATTKDQFLTTGLGLTARIGASTEIGFDLVRSDADGDIRTDAGAGQPPFPTLVTELLNARVRVDYRRGEHWGFKLLLEHERYDSTDWALDGLGPASIPAILSFGAESPDYDVTVVRAQASYRF